jgi:hypothetical protein
MTIANVISVSYKIEDASPYVYVTLQRREPICDTFTLRFYSPPSWDNFCMLDARLRGLNVKTKNRAEFEAIYKRARGNFIQSVNTMKSIKEKPIICSHVHENVLSNF